LGGTIGFLVGIISVGIISILFPNSRDLLTNPIILMIIVVTTGLIGNSIEEKGSLSANNIKEAVKGGVFVTFSWFAICIGIGLVIAAIVFFFKILSFMPRNY
jgi:flagellar biosynthesis protein FlhB